nr:Gx transporter family protein [Oceanispirochaeta crateris]
MFTEKKLNRIALLGAFSMFLSTIEYLFPRPIPFMRLGLANLPVILSLELFSAPAYFLLILLKVLGQALVNGTLASYVFLFSMVGSFASGLLMWLCYKALRPRISFVGISVMGALTSNMAQIILSISFIFGPSAWRILPLFLGIGLVSGLFIGLFAQRFSEKSKWWELIRQGALKDDLLTEEAVDEK